MTHYAAVLAFVAVLIVIAAAIWGAALLISEVSHRLRGDIRCTGPTCGCHGTSVGRPRP